MEGEISYQEFVDGCWKLQGEAEKHVDSQLLGRCFSDVLILVHRHFAGESTKSRCGIQRSKPPTLFDLVTCGHFKIRHMQARSLDMKIIQLAPWPGFDTIHDKTSGRSMGEGSIDPIGVICCDISCRLLELPPPTIAVNSLFWVD